MTQSEAVSEALDRAGRITHQGIVDWTVDAPRPYITGTLIETFDDRARLAGEVVRLREEIADLRADHETVCNLLRAHLAQEQARVQRLCRAIRGVFADKLRLENAIQDAIDEPVVDPPPRWAGIPDGTLVTCATCGTEIAVERAVPRGHYFGQWLCCDHAPAVDPESSAKGESK